MNNNRQTVILSRRRRIYLNSYPPSGGSRIFYSCALIFYMFLQNEPNFLNCKTTISHFLNKTNACCLLPLACNSNPIQTQNVERSEIPDPDPGLRETQIKTRQRKLRDIKKASAEGRIRIDLPALAGNAEANFSAKPPILAHAVSGPKTPIRRFADKISLFLTPKTAKKSNPKNAQNTPMTDQPLRPQNPDSTIQTPQIALYDTEKPQKNEADFGAKHPPHSKNFKRRISRRQPQRQAHRRFR